VANLHKLTGEGADSLQDMFSAKEQSTGFRRSKTPKPMQDSKGLSPLAGREGESGSKGEANSKTWFCRFNPVFCSLAVLHQQNCGK